MDNRHGLKQKQTYSWYDCSGNKNCYVEAFQKIVGVNCLSGISFWQAGTVCAFIDSSEALKKAGVKCSGSSGGGTGGDGKKYTSTNGKSGKCKQPGNVADCGSGRRLYCT